MNKNRLEAFSDGVLAIIITIMVLEIKVPHTTAWKELEPLIPVLLSYVISFLLVGIYWGNHHNLLHCVKHINSGILLSNLHLLFWLSLVPVVTGWMGENHFRANTIIVYAILLVICGLAYALLQNRILKSIDQENLMVVAIQKQTPKVVFSLVADVAAIPFAFAYPAISGILFIVQSAIWLVPDKNIEKAFKNLNAEK
ncbi:MAG: TMEM175 family protein [Ferruginibacter sp.]